MSTHRAIEPKYREKMNELARDLDTAFNPNAPAERVTGFILLTFDFGDPHDNSRINYISNGERPACITALKEWIARAEGRLIEPESGVQQA